MEKEFIPYEQALALKELGFDEPCFGWYSNMDGNVFRQGYCETYLGIENCAKAPLYQQVFRWFRENYNLKGHVEAVEYLDGTPNTYHWCIFNKYNSGYDQLTYEEAELECLKKLIEICKKN